MIKSEKLQLSEEEYLKVTSSLKVCIQFIGQSTEKLIQFAEKASVILDDDEPWCCAGCQEQFKQDTYELLLCKHKLCMDCRENCLADTTCTQCAETEDQIQTYNSAGSLTVLLSSEYKQSFQ